MSSIFYKTTGPWQKLQRIASALAAVHTETPLLNFNADLWMAVPHVPYRAVADINDAGERKCVE